MGTATIGLDPVPRAVGPTRRPWIPTPRSGWRRDDRHGESTPPRPRWSANRPAPQQATKPLLSSPLCGAFSCHLLHADRSDRSPEFRPWTAGQLAGSTAAVARSCLVRGAGHGGLVRRPLRLLPHHPRDHREGEGRAGTSWQAAQRGLRGRHREGDCAPRGGPRDRRRFRAGHLGGRCRDST